MLTREECEALAAAYPEVREHALAMGDWYWSGDRVAVQDQGGMGETFLGDAPCRQSGTLWCPRIDQILNLARRIAAEIIDRPGLRRMCELTLTIFDGVWIFQPGLAPVPVEYGAGRGESAEDAICDWLRSVAADRTMA